MIRWIGDTRTHRPVLCNSGSKEFSNKKATHEPLSWPPKKPTIQQSALWGDCLPFKPLLIHETAPTTCYLYKIFNILLVNLNWQKSRTLNQCSIVATQPMDKITHTMTVNISYVSQSGGWYYYSSSEKENTIHS